jgi:predicted transcriptional regulator
MVPREKGLQLLGGGAVVHDRPRLDPAERDAHHLGVGVDGIPALRRRQAQVHDAAWSRFYRPQQPRLRGEGTCITLSYMKTASVTIRLDAKLERELDRLCREIGRSRSDVVRDALRRQLAVARFEKARRALLPLAESQGFLTDEDVFADVS